MKRIAWTVMAGLGLVSTAPAAAVVGYADTVIDFFDSGAGPLAGPYGGTDPGAFPIAVSTSVVLGNDPGPAVDFLSLPTGSYVTVGFVDEAVFDQAGDDIFIQETGGNGERADVYVSTDLTTFFLLGTAIDNGTTAFDLASIGFLTQVNAVRIIGLDTLGASPGFDVVNVQALEFVPRVPEPATWGLMALGFGLVGAALRRRHRTTVLA